MKNAKYKVFLFITTISISVVAGANPFIDAMKKQPRISVATTYHGWASEGTHVLNHIRIRPLDNVTVPGDMTTLEYERRNGSVKNFGDYIASMYINKNCATKEIKEAINKYGYTIDVKVVAHDTNEIISSKTMKYCK